MRNDPHVNDTHVKRNQFLQHSKYILRYKDQVVNST